MEKQIRAELDCPICMETFKKPILILPCGHHLCKVCLDQMPGESSCKSCPNCRAIITSEDGELPRNRTLENVIEQLNQVTLKKEVQQSPLKPKVKEENKVDKDKQRQDEIKRVLELAETSMKSNNYSAAKTALSKIKADLNGVERLSVTIKIARCLTELKKTSEAKEMCCEIAAMATAIQPERKECIQLLEDIKILADKLAEKKEYTTVMNMVKCGVGICRMIDYRSVGVNRMSIIADAVQNVAKHMGSSGREECKKLCVPFLNELRELIKSTTGVKPAYKLTREVWCLKYTGYCYLVTGDYNSCVLVNKEAIALTSHENAVLTHVFGLCYNNLGVAYQNLKLYGDAEKAFITANEVYYHAKDWLDVQQKIKCIKLASKNLTDVVSKQANA